MKIRIDRSGEVSVADYQLANNQYVFGRMIMDGDTIKLENGAVIILYREDKGEITIYTKQMKKEELNNNYIEVCDCIDKFEYPFLLQALLLQIYGHRDEYKDLDEKELFYVTAMSLIEELIEIRNYIGLKPWKNKSKDEIKKEVLLEEFADLMHFFLQLAIILDIKPAELLQAYVNKVYKNVLRQLAVPEYAIKDENLTKEFVIGLAMLLEILGSKTLNTMEVNHE